MVDMKEKLKEIKTLVKTTHGEYPELMEPLTELYKRAEGDGALSKKTKEIISVALSTASQCDWCIAYHVKRALDAGATKDELIEACFVSTLIFGTSAWMYIGSVLKAIEEHGK
ncbi:MAG TPA: carboxymuconolactone decarboxylase family protein [Methanosarcinales archaeon]|nr:carboxymuconolactone decarboxylase family protein [Methanosarcinales archaeon]